MLSKEQRKKIEGAVLRSRRLLEDEFDRLLRTYGLMPEKAIERIPQEKQEVRKRLEIALKRESEDCDKARRRYVKYAAFTFLNRIFALRISEVHELIKETVITRDEYGEKSRRERDLLDMHPELISNPEEQAFGALKEAYEDVGEYVPHLFDFEDPYSILRPSLVAYRNVRKIISEIPEEILRQFETIGWAYQYFNTKEKEEHPEILIWKIPALILEKNLYGIDIDLRATQIAAMALYLKARTAFENEKEEGMREFELRRMNIVCADIHFVDGEMRRKFLPFPV